MASAGPRNKVKAAGFKRGGKAPLISGKGIRKTKYPKTKGSRVGTEGKGPVLRDLTGSVAKRRNKGRAKGNARVASAPSNAAGYLWIKREGEGQDLGPPRAITYTARRRARGRHPKSGPAARGFPGVGSSPRARPATTGHPSPGPGTHPRRLLS